MTLKVHHLRPAPGAKTAKTRVGRGEAGKRGKIDNTQSETWTAGGGISLINDGGQLGISIGYFDTNSGVPDRPDTAHDHGGEEEEGEADQQAGVFGGKHRSDSPLRPKKRRRRSAVVVRTP